MSIPAFYIDAPLQAGETIDLTGQEAAHAHVLRLAPGAEVNLFDGNGAVAVCKVSRVEKHSLALALSHVSHVPEPTSRAIIALAMSKATRRGFFMEKAAELGASQVWLWESARSVGRITSGTCDSCAGQLAAGARQSGNPWFPRLRNVANLDGLLRAAAGCSVNWRLLPWEDQDRQAMLPLDMLGRPGVTLYVIGPEGGFAPEEVERFKKENFALVSLGKRVLRCETAAALCLGLHSWASQLPGKPDASAQ